MEPGSGHSSLEQRPHHPGHDQALLPLGFSEKKDYSLNSVFSLSPSQVSAEPLFHGLMYVIIPLMKRRRQKVRKVQLTVTCGQVEEIRPCDFKARLVSTGLLYPAPLRPGMGPSIAGALLTGQTRAESWRGEAGDQRMDSSDLSFLCIRGPQVPGPASSCRQKGSGIQKQDRRNTSLGAGGTARSFRAIFSENLLPLTLCLKPSCGSTLLLEGSSESFYGLHWGHQTMVHAPHPAGSLIL